MGLDGLQTLLKKNANLFQRIRLSDTKLIIDANNLYFKITSNLNAHSYRKTHRHDRYGCDLVAFGREIRAFFRVLDMCNITPILVYDGSVIGKQSTAEQRPSKEKTSRRRALNRFNHARKITEDSAVRQPVMWALTSSVFKAIVRELGIRIIQAPYGADPLLARLANEFSCPVLTNDSDFIIYPLPAGFIMFDTFEYEKLKRHSEIRNCCNVRCLLYSQSKMTQLLPGLKAETMPLLRVLLGNGVVGLGTLRNKATLIYERKYSGKMIVETDKHIKIANLLEWLRGRSLNEAIESLLVDVESGQEKDIRKMINFHVRHYAIGQRDNLEAELEAVYPQSEATEANLASKLKPAAYLARLFKQSMSGTILDIIFHNTYYANTMIDDLDQPSSNLTIEYRPLSLALTLLRPRTYEGMTVEQREIEIERDSYRYYDRLDGKYVMQLISPMEQLENFGSLEHLTLYSVIKLKPAIRKSMLFATFRFNKRESDRVTATLSPVFKTPFINEARICFMLVKYIGIETKITPMPQFVDGLMLTLFFYAALDGQLTEEAARGNYKYRMLILKLNPHSAARNPFEYDPSPVLFRKINHSISQLQNAFMAYELISSILNSDLPKPRVDRYFNGVLIFRLTKLLSMRDVTTDKLCPWLPTLLNLCDNMKKFVRCAA